jgi:hypothetical protein
MKCGYGFTKGSVGGSSCVQGPECIGNCIWIVIPPIRSPFIIWLMLTLRKGLRHASTSIFMDSDFMFVSTID